MEKFDAHSYCKKLVEAGMSEKLAEVQAEEMTKVAELFSRDQNASLLSKNELKYWERRLVFKLATITLAAFITIGIAIMVLL